MQAEAHTKISSSSPSGNINSTRKHRGNSPIIGNMEQNQAPFKAIKKSAFLHVYKVHPYTSGKEILDYLKSFYPEDSEKLMFKYHEMYSLFKVTIHESNAEFAMCPSKWPQGTHTNVFFHYRKRRTDET